MRQTPHQPAAARAALPPDYLAVVERFAAQMEQGCAPWLLPWKAAALEPALPVGALGHHFTGVTVLLLWEATHTHGFTRPLWLTQRQCHAAGGRLLDQGGGTTGFFADGGSLRPFTLYNISQCVGVAGREPPRPQKARPFPIIGVREAFTAELSGAFICAGMGIAPRLLRRECLPTWAAELRADPYRLFDAGDAAHAIAADRLARIPDLASSGGQP